MLKASPGSRPFTFFASAVIRMVALKTIRTTHGNSDCGNSIHRRTWTTDGQWRLIQAGRLIEKKASRQVFGLFLNSRRAIQKQLLRLPAKVRYKTKLQVQVRDLGITDKVFFRGFIHKENARTFYLSHIFLHRAKLASMEIRKAFPIQCSKRWPAGFRFRHRPRGIS